MPKPKLEGGQCLIIIGTEGYGKTLRTRQHRQDAEQKKIRQREAPSLSTARIGNGTQSVNQTGITDHGILTSYTLPQSDPRFPRMCQLHHGATCKTPRH